MESGTIKRIVPTDAAALGVIRAAICGFVLLQMLLTDFVAFGHLPTTVMRPTGAMQLLPWRFYDALITPRGLLILKVLLVVSLLCAGLGLFTAITTKSAALLFLFYEGLVRSFGLFNHDEMIGVYILVVLAFTLCGDSFSLDRMWGRVKPRLPGFAYGYPILLMRIFGRVVLLQFGFDKNASHRPAIFQPRQFARRFDLAFAGQFARVAT